MMHNVTLIPGDGIGPEISLAVRRILDASGAKIEWDVQEAGADQMERFGTPLPQSAIDSIRRTGVALKGPITTPVGTGFRSVNVALRKELDLYVNLRPAKNYPNVKSRYEKIDIVLVRENTEDLYAGVEHMVGKDAAESIKIFTRAGCRRILRYAFEYAVKNHRRKVTAVHKANIMKCTDGMFLEEARAMALEYPNIEFEDRIIDALCMKLVQTPEIFDVLVLPNLYGDIVSDLCAGLVGGLGVAPGANLGEKEAVFEAIHGSVPHHAGTNTANPMALLLSGVMMLRHLGEQEAADRVENALTAVIGEGEFLPQDLGGSTGTQEFADAIIAKL
ncbi:MAG: isocitrate/isopropylmalate dehydrogenase family protein [Clostridia bacterium]|nr:isocitrate/isopropylmalate dehydrogenase family protein [Clostridia bacterium]